MPTIHINGKPYDTRDGKNLLEVALSHGFDLPYFCWHPAMGSVGACRQCAVKQFKDEDDDKGKIVMSCMEPAKDGARISIEDHEASEFRANIIEWLMTNHPHDCPTCDEGGECHLQDMTVMTGHNYRRHRFNKRTYRNQDLGPCINHEMNRCIQCYRCVRFYDDFAGGVDLKAMAAKNHVYFGRHEEGTLESVFSGNLVEVCPTGVFTDKTLKKQYTRKWDFTNAPSICHHCSLGCNIIGSARYGELRRIQSRYNGAVNGYFLCDRGRFGYEHVNHEKRIKYAYVRQYRKSEPKAISLDQSIDAAKKAIAESKGVVGIGSGRASLEANFALRQLVGKDNFYQGISAKEQQLNALAKQVLQNHPGHIPSLREVSKADAVLVLGEDLLNTAPMLGLYVRQATRNKGFEVADNLQIPRWHDHAVREAAQDERSPLFLLTPSSTDQDELAQRTARLAPNEITRVGFAVANLISGEAPKVADLDNELEKLAKEISDALNGADHPLIIAGTSLREPALLQAAGNLSQALGEKSWLSLVLQEANSLGTAILGGDSMEAAIEKVMSGEADTAIILENDLYRFGDPNKLDAFFEKCKTVISLDYLVHQTSEKADIILPAGAFSETDGTMVNNEGRAQRYYQVHVPKEDVTESWRLLGRIMDDDRIQNFDDLIQAVAASDPLFGSIADLALPSGYRKNGQKIPRASHRFSGRTAIDADQHVNEPKPPEDPDSSLSYTMEGYHGEQPSSEVPFFWSPGWNSQQAINKYQIEVGGPLHDGDPGKPLFRSPGKGAYSNDLPEKFAPKENEWLIVPAHHTFGSEQLSNHGPAIQQRTVQPHFAMTEGTAHALNARTELEVTIGDQQIKLPVKIDNSLPKQVITMPVGFEGLPYVDLPALIQIKPMS